ncbi:NAD kinase 2, mitochondrial-like [Linepithema humile]|uniref:NAD kinase 2, mitochondrial-like n=1 Tax=Linepithema humile TaxID=83485 RepID=UPI00351EFE4E
MRSTQRKIADALQPCRRVLPWLALNEMFTAEFLTSRPITLIIETDDGQKITARSSGLPASVWARTLASELHESTKSYKCSPPWQLDEKVTSELLYKYHSNLLFPSNSELRLKNDVYEMCNVSQFVLPISQKQICRKTKIKSRSFDIVLVLEGSISLPFNDDTATFEIRREYSLKNITL